MNVENTKKQMRKGVLELCILAIMSDGEAYPSDIITKLKDSELIIKEGTLYPLLTRLKNAELLEYNWRESTSGPPRKYYYVTEKGKEFLNELWGAWSTLIVAVEQATNRLAESSLPPKLLAVSFDDPEI
jgi:PadR family transcriptional regulator, regulatory protein PadR